MALRHGFEAVALEFDDFSNAARWPAFRDGMRTAGIQPGLWFTDPGTMVFCPEDAAFVVAEVEGNWDFDGLMGSLPHIPEVPRAVITNFSGLLVLNADGTTNVEASRARCEPIKDWDVQTEFYKEGLQPDATPAHLEFIARSQCGFTGRVAPAFGVYGPWTLETYAPYMGTPGWGVYLAEYLK